MSTAVVSLVLVFDDVRQECRERRWRGERFKVKIGLRGEIYINIHAYYLCPTSANILI
jgi:hypothetical protein